MSSATQTRPGARDARLVPLTRAQRLAQDAAAAAEVRAFAEHPDVVALQVERVRRQVDVLMWVGIGLGLAFTMVNVQQFAAEGAAVWSLPWLAAWLLDPMVSLVLIAVLRAEQVTARWQVDTGKWIQRTKWFAFAATYAMNTWQSYAALSLAGIVLHSVPPALVFLAAESAPVLRDRLTESVLRAAAHRREAAGVLPTVQTDPAVNASPTVHDTAPQGVHGGAGERPARPVRERARPRQKAPVRNGRGRRSRHDYLAVARELLAPGTEVTPAWVRQVTGCSRGLSSALAAELRAELEPTTTVRAADREEHAA